MQKIILIKSSHLFAYLRSYSIGQDSSRYFSYQPLSSKYSDLLQKLNIPVADDVDFDESEQRQFINDLSAVNCSIALNSTSDLWWATDFSSKNRFSSKIPYLIEQLLWTSKVIDHNSQQTLLIIDPPYEILKSLQNNFSSTNYDFQVVGYKTDWMRQWVLKIRKELGYVYHAGRMMVRSWKARRVLGSSAKAVQQFDQASVIKTFVYDHSFSQQSYRDVFFGKLVEQALQDKTKHVVIWVQILGDYSKCLQAMKQLDHVTIIPIEQTLSWRQIFIQCLRLMFFFDVQVDDALTVNDVNVSDVIRKRLFQTANGVQFSQLIHRQAIESIVRKVKISKWLMTYENYPWERGVVQALRKYQPDLKIQGYQHTVVPQSYLNYMVSAQEERLAGCPDEILTTGLESAKVIEHYSSHEQARVVPACGLRFEQLLSLPEEDSPVRREIKNLLIPLEGFYEIIDMVLNAIEQLANDDSVRVRIRTHPLLPWQNFAERYNIDIKQYKNFEISNDTLNADLQWSDVVMYWSTTVSLEAMLMGKPVIHYHKRSVLSYDPLFLMSAFKQTLYPKQSLLDVIQKFRDLSDDQWSDQQSQARQYIHRYLNDISTLNLSKFDV